jgi:hypothetical protein
MIDIVYALGSGSTWDNNELRYSLRSVEKHVSNYRDVYIVGECPHWLQNVIHLPFEDKYGHERNIMEKIKHLCEHNRPSENFLFINDDHFFLKDINAVAFRFYHKGSLAKTIKKRLINDVYKDALNNTLAMLSHNKFTTLNFDIHTPIVYNKKKFIETMDSYDWSLEYVIKSLYCNSNGIKGVEMQEDCKISGRIAYWRLLQKIKDRNVFSIGDKCLHPYPGEKESSVKVLLNELFPNKSKYEM